MRLYTVIKHKANGVVQHNLIICELISFGALVVEYADNIDEAEKNRFEDGELFYLSDYQDVDELASDILKEIEKGIFG